jgi:hypothetical protein
MINNSVLGEILWEQMVLGYPEFGVRWERPRVAPYGGDDDTDLDAFDVLDALVLADALDGAVRVGVRSEEGPADIFARADLVVYGVAGVGNVLA